MTTSRLRALALAVLLPARGLGLQTSIVDADQFERAVFAPGVSTLIKFYAPWCGHCKAMAPAWSTLAAEYASSTTVQLAEVDCTSPGGEPLCVKYGVEGYPTLKYLQANDRDLQDAEVANNELATLREFSERTLRPGCSQAHPGACGEEDTELLKSFGALSGAQRAAELAKLSQPLEEAQAKLSRLQKELEAIEEQMEEAEEKLDEVSSSVGNKILLLKRVIQAVDKSSSRILLE